MDEKKMETKPELRRWKSSFAGDWLPKAERGSWITKTEREKGEKLIKTDPPHMHTYTRTHARARAHTHTHTHTRTPLGLRKMWLDKTVALAKITCGMQKGGIHWAFHLPSLSEVNVPLKKKKHYVIDFEVLSPEEKSQEQHWNVFHNIKPLCLA